MAAMTPLPPSRQLHPGRLVQIAAFDWENATAHEIVQEESWREEPEFPKGRIVRESWGFLLPCIGTIIPCVLVVFGAWALGRLNASNASVPHPYPTGQVSMSEVGADVVAVGDGGSGFTAEGTIADAGEQTMTIGGAGAVMSGVPSVGWFVVKGHNTPCIEQCGEIAAACGMDNGGTVTVMVSADSPLADDCLCAGER